MLAKKTSEIIIILEWPDCSHRLSEGKVHTTNQTMCSGRHYSHAHSHCVMNQTVPILFPLPNQMGVQPNESDNMAVEIVNRERHCRSHYRPTLVLLHSMLFILTITNAAPDA